MVLFLEQHFILSLQSDFQTTRIQSKTWWMWTMRGSTAGVLRGGPQGLERSTKTDDLSEGMNISLCLQCPVCNSLQGYFAFASLIPADWRQQLLLPHQLWSLLLWNEALQVLRSQRLQLFALNLDPVELCKGGVCSCGTLLSRSTPAKTCINNCLRETRHQNICRCSAAAAFYLRYCLDRSSFPTRCSLWITLPDVLPADDTVWERHPVWFLSDMCWRNSNVIWGPPCWWFPQTQNNDHISSLWGMKSPPVKLRRPNYSWTLTPRINWNGKLWVTSCWMLGMCWMTQHSLRGFGIGGAIHQSAGTVCCPVALTVGWLADWANFCWWKLKRRPTFHWPPTSVAAAEPDDNCACDWDIVQPCFTAVSLHCVARQNSVWIHKKKWFQ